MAGDVYAGFTVGTGATTGNTVNIGDTSANAIAAGTQITGTIYGGSGTTATDNTLNVKKKGVTAGSVANFDKIKFNIDSNVADGDTVLTLRNNTTIANSTIEQPAAATVANWLGTTMEKTAHLIKMQGGSTLTLTGYTAGASQKRAGDVEYAYKTDNNLAATTGSLDLSAYKWQNANVLITDNTHADVFGGKSTLEPTGETNKNQLTLQAGATAITNAIAGDTQTANDTSTGNILKIEGNAAVTGDAIGGKTKAGKASGNQAIVDAAATGTIANLKGAYSTAGAVEKNVVEIKGGAVTNAYGGESAGATAAASENSVTVQGGTVTHVYGARAAGTAKKNAVSIQGGTVTGTILGAESAGDAEENSVTIKAAVTASVTGARSTTGSARKNTLNLHANVTGNVLGAQAVAAASDAVINVVGATVTGNVTGGQGTTTQNNLISLTGATITGDVIGGTAGSTGNTLAIHYTSAQPTTQIHDFSNVDNLHFYLGEDASSTTPPLLQLGAATKNISALNVGVGISGRARNLSVNDIVSLMKVAPGGTLTMASPQANVTTGMQGVSLLYEFSLEKRNADELVAKVLKAAINERAKSFAETRAAAMDFINRGADLLAGGAVSAVKTAARGEEADKDAKGYHIWASIDNGKMRAETGSYAETNGTNLAVGWAREFQQKEGKILFTPFVEYGRGTYDSYLDDGTHGSGKVGYLGAGLMGRYEGEKGLWAEVALHGGRAKSDYTGSIAAGVVSEYSGTNGYYAAHVGVGQQRELNDKEKLGAYVRYFYSRQAGMDATLNTGEEYTFGGVSSSRLRLGATYSKKDTETSEIYAGLAYEYEFAGEARASYAGYDTPSPSLKGGSYMAELGYRFAPKGRCVSYDLHLKGWQGTRQGITGGFNVNWAF